MAGGLSDFSVPEKLGLISCDTLSLSVAPSVSASVFVFDSVHFRHVKEKRRLRREQVIPLKYCIQNTLITVAWSNDIIK